MLTLCQVYNPLTNCTINANTANGVSGGSGTSGGGSGANAEGGAIFNRGTLAVSNSTFSANSATGGNGGNGTGSTSHGGNGGGCFGGAIRTTNSSVTLINSTLGGNSATGGNGGTGVVSNGSAGAGVGGAVYGLSAAITNCTLSGNSAAGGAAAGTGGDANGGGITLGNSGTSIRNTIIAGNSVTAGSGGSATGPDVGSAITSQGYNLIGDTSGSSGWIASDLLNTNPLLGPLQNNGGSTYTMKPQSNSPAIDKGGSGGPVADQRGFARPIDLDNATYPNAFGGDGSDIGAFEVGDAQRGPSFVVTTLSDYDKGGAGACQTDDCTLREAINAANANSDLSIITFGPSATGYYINLTSALPDITTNINLQGPVDPAARVTVRGNQTFRIFFFAAGTTSAVSNLIVTDGKAASTLGPALGGALYNLATLTLTDCEFDYNAAFAADAVFGPGDDADGGAIYNNAVLTVNRCTFFFNATYAGRGGNGGFRRGAGRGGDANGSAIFNDTSGTLALSNCTIATHGGLGGAGGDGGSSPGGNGGAWRGALFNRGAMTVTACTISGNGGGTGSGGSGTPNGMPGSVSGGIAASGGTSIVGDTISAGNFGANGGGIDADGAFNSNGYNLIGSGDHSTGFINGINHDQIGTDAAPVNARFVDQFPGYYGGLAATMALLSSSPAINAGDPSAPSQDQRYYLRSGVPDIGAFEFGGTVGPMSVVSRKTHGTIGDFDINLPLAGPVGVECRTGGATNDHQLIVTFPVPVTVNGTSQAQVTSGTGQVGAGGASNGGVVTINGTVVTVPLTNVSNAQKIIITLSNVSDGINTNAALNVPMGVLAGDTNKDTRVNVGDTNQTKSLSGQPLDSGENFRNDVNLDGRINVGDTNFVKAHSGSALP